MPSKDVKRSIFQRILGIPATSPPVDEAAWGYTNGKLVLELERVPELKKPGGAVRLEGKTLPARVLVVHGEDGELRAFRNRCQHIGHRRLDPVPGEQLIQCCSVSKSTYDYRGRVVSGPAKQPLDVLETKQEDGRLTIFV